MPDRKVTGGFHNATIMGVTEKAGERYASRRVPLEQLQPQHIAAIREPALREALRARLAQVGGDAKKAFAEPFYGGRRAIPANLVKKVKVWQRQPSGVQTQHGVASNDSMVRVDVYFRDSRYYLVPVYARDIAEGKLPYRAIVAGSKPESKWPIVDETYSFVATFHPWDIIRIDNGAGDVTFGYYRGVSRSTGSILVVACNGQEVCSHGHGVCRALDVSKFGIDVLGHIYRIKEDKPLIRMH